jgi:hypothetical protein
MTANVVIHLSTSRSPDQAWNAQVVHSQTGGRLMCVDTPRRAGEPPVAGAAIFSPRRMEDVFATAMASPHGGVIDVMPPHSAAIIDFMKQRPGTVESMSAFVVSVARHESSQRQVTELIEELVTARMHGDQLRLIFVDAHPEGSMETDYSHLLGRLRLAEFPHCTTEAFFAASSTLESAREYQLPLALVLNQMVDFEAELGIARSTGAPQSTLHQLALKVLAQRKLLAARAEINLFFDRLLLSRAADTQWLDEMLHAWRLANPEQSAITEPAGTNLHDGQRSDEQSDIVEA